MSTASIEFGGERGSRPSLSHWMKRVRVPLHAWSRRRRWVAILLIATLVCVLGTHGWIVADFGGVEASRAAFEASARHLADARRALAQLPALRRDAAADWAAVSLAGLPASSQATSLGGLPINSSADLPARVPGDLPVRLPTDLSAGLPARPPDARSLAPWTSADDVRIVSELAAQNSVTLLTLEPGAASGAGAESMRPLQITAHTDFVHLMAFLRGLSDLPVLIVPVDVTVKREAASLAVSATLRVFSALRPTLSSASADAFADASLDSEDEEDVVFFDPFALPQMFAYGDLPDVSQLRLVGILRDRARGLALLDTPDGATTVMSGQQIGAERVTKLDALGITLAKGDETRTLSLMEAF